VVVIPACVEELEKHCFASSWVHSIVFEEESRLKVIREGAFKKCNLKKIEIPGSCEIEVSAFAGCRLSEKARSRILKMHGPGCFVDPMRREMGSPVGSPEGDLGLDLVLTDRDAFGNE
jgi:hypothetical protein